MAYADEKFSRAVHRLATLPGGIHERLIDVYIHEISHIDLERDVPDYLMDDFNLLLLRLLGKDAAAFEMEERIHSAVRAMSEDEAVEVARQILSLAYHLENASVEIKKVNDESNKADGKSTLINTRGKTKKVIYSLHTFPFQTPDFFGSDKKYPPRFLNEESDGSCK